MEIPLHARAACGADILYTDHSIAAWFETGMVRLGHPHPYPSHPDITVFHRIPMTSFRFQENMKNTPHTFFRHTASLALLATMAALPSASYSQSTWTGATSGQWGTASNWTGGVPNAIDAVVNINTALTVNVSDTGTGGTYPYTFGTLASSLASGSVVIGNNTITTDVLTAAVSTSAPIINVTNGGGTIFFYANLQGTQGLTKNGPGKFTFRFNGADQTYSGPITINGGIFGINQDSSLGDVSNDISIANGARLMIEPGSNSGTITLGTGRNITLTGAQSQISSSAAAVTGVIQGSVSGVGGLTKVDAGRLNLNGAVTYEGDTRVVGGILDFNSGTFSTTANVLVNSAAASTLDLSDLTSFTLNGATRTFVVQPGTTASGTHTVDALLSKGVNNVTVQTITAGGATGTSQGSSNLGAIRLGETNNLNVDTLNLGGFNARGEITMQSSLVSPTVTLRGTAGGSTRVANINVGSTSSGTRSGDGTMNLNGATVDALVGTMTIGSHIAAAVLASTNSFSFNSGTVDATTVILGNKTNTGTPTLTTSFNQGGGTAKVQTLTFGVNGGTDQPNFQSSYNLAAGTLRAQTLQAGTGAFAAGSARRVGWTGGTIANYDGSTNLTINGVDTSTGGRITIAASTTAAKAFAVDSGRVVTLGSNTALTAFATDVVVSKTGAGTLVLAGDSAAFGGTFEQTAGNLEIGAVNAISTFNAANFTWNGGTLNFDLSGASGSDKISLGNGVFTRGAGAASGFVFDFGGGGVAGGEYTLASFGSFGGSFAFSISNLATDLVGTLEIRELGAIDDLVLTVATAIPEPSSFGLVAGLGALGCLAGRRRRRS